MALQQALYWDGWFGTSLSADFTTELYVNKDSGTNGTNPATGSDLVVVIWTTASITSVGTNNGEDETTPSFSCGGASNAYVYLIPSIASGCTSIDVELGSSSAPAIWVFEDDESLTIEDEVTFTDDGDGFDADPRAFDYTAAGSAELGLMFCKAIGNTDITGISGSSVVAKDTSELRAVVYKEITSSGAGTWDYQFSSTTSASCAGVTYTQGAGGGGGSAINTLNPILKHIAGIG